MSNRNIIWLIKLTTLHLQLNIVNFKQMSSQNLSSEESISIIENSLKHNSKQKTGASNYYIIWGFILFAYYFIQFINLHFKTTTTALIADNSTLLFPLGGLLSFLQSRKDTKTEKVVPLTEKVYLYGWIGASIGIGVLSFTYFKDFITILCFGVLLIFGLVNFIIGGVIGFKPLIIGGVLSMLLCILIAYSYLEYKLLITAIGVFFSCAIPGIIMKFSKNNV
jgi:hypothetical protein